MPATPRLARLAVAAAAVVLLSGCVDGDPGPLPGPTALPGVSPTASPRPTGTPGPTPSATATPSPSAAPADPGATPIDADCESLVPLQALYDLDPNLALLADEAPTGAAAEAVAAGGVACTLVHTSSSARIELAVSQPGPAALAAARAAAGSPLDLGVAGLDGYSSGSTVQGFTSARRYSAQSASFDVTLLAEVVGIAYAALG